ncbi:MAG: hypothetical protein OEL54_06455, partial [Flavobacteriaceae bacterium]|nr:hypothetical protein [Flavobacteriaceae bacterium]
MAKSYSSTLSKKDSAHIAKLRQAAKEREERAATEPEKADPTKTAEIKDYVQDQENILNLFPGSPLFLGKNKLYEKPKRSIAAKAAKLNVEQIRKNVVNFADKKGVSSSRQLIQDGLQKFPFLSDLHVVNAIQTFQDISQSGLEKDKLDSLNKNLREISIAIHNNGLSIFNTIWFLKIYCIYLSLLSDRINRALNTTVTLKDKKVDELRKKVSQKKFQVLSLISIKDTQKTLKRLS